MMGLQLNPQRRFFLGVPSANLVAWATRWDSSDSLTDVYAITSHGSVVRQKAGLLVVTDFFTPPPCQRVASIAVTGGLVFMGLTVPDPQSVCVRQIVQMPVDGGSVEVVTAVEWVDNLQVV